jgi:hypothetical protein
MLHLVAGWAAIFFRASNPHELGAPWIAAGLGQILGGLIILSGGRSRKVLALVHAASLPTLLFGLPLFLTLLAHLQDLYAITALVIGLITISPFLVSVVLFVLYVASEKAQQEPSRPHALARAMTIFIVLGPTSYFGITRVVSKMRIEARAEVGIAPVTFSPDSKKLAAGGRRARLYDLASGDQIFTSAKVPTVVTGLAVSPSMSKLFIVYRTEDLELRAWVHDLATGRDTATFRAANGQPAFLDESKVTIGEKIIDTAHVGILRGPSSSSIPGAEGGYGFAANSAGTLFIRSGKYWHWRFLTREMSALPEELLPDERPPAQCGRLPPSQLALSERGRFAAIAYPHGRLVVWDVLTNQRVSSLEVIDSEEILYRVGDRTHIRDVCRGMTGVTTAALSEARSAVATCRGKTFSIFNIPSGQRQLDLNLAFHCFSVALSPDGTWAAVGGTETLRLIDLNQPEHVRVLMAPSAQAQK